MQNFLDKLENFLFDVLGLILPGFVILALAAVPVIAIDFGQIYPSNLSNPEPIRTFQIVDKFLNTLLENDVEIVFLAITILVYLTGHVVKVFAIIYYETMSSLIDDQILSRLKKGVDRLAGGNVFSRTLKFLANKIEKPPLNILGKIFTFKTKDLEKNDKAKEMLEGSINRINAKLGTTFPKSWDYYVFKLSTVIAEQENVKTLTTFFLAKYNLYRSLSFIFFLGIFYFLLISFAVSSLFPRYWVEFFTYASLASAIFWFTFHVKYKRYWKLCGTEALVSLFHYLHRKDLQ